MSKCPGARLKKTFVFAFPLLIDITVGAVATMPSGPKFLSAALIAVKKK